MRNLDRDRQKVLIARYSGIAPEVDGDGLYTGRNVPSYSAQSEFWPTRTMARGEAVYDLFGQKLDYDVTLTIDDPSFEVAEADLLWIDDLYADMHDHIVRRVGRKGGFTVIAAKKVEVTA